MTPAKINHFTRIYDGHLNLLAQVEKKASDPEMDRTGLWSTSVAGLCRDIGVLGFLIRRDIAEFRARLSQSCDIWAQTVARHQAGEPIDSSYVTALLYVPVLEALACGAFDVSVKLAKALGGRAELERAHNTAFDKAFGYAIREVILESNCGHVAALEKVVSSKGNTDFRGYREALAAIQNSDPSALDAGFRSALDGHVRQSRSKGRFSGTLDEHICVWCLGLANLALFRGITVELNNSLVPTELLANN